MRVEARQLPEPCARRHDRRLQEPGPRLTERPRQSLLDKKRAYEVQEERDEHLVDAAPKMDGRCDRRPQGPERGCSDQRSGRGDPGRRIRPVKRDRSSAKTAESDLAFGADVDDSRTKAEGDARPRQQIRRRPIERDAQLMRRASGAHRKRSEGGERIVPGKGDQRRRADERKNNRNDNAQPDPFRCDESQRRSARRDRSQVRRRRLRHAARPDIQRPICARSTSARGTIPTN